MAKSSFRRRSRRPAVLGLVLLILLWCSILGWGLAALSQMPTPTQPAVPVSPGSANSTSGKPAVIGTVDRVPANLQAGQAAYQKTCGACHLAIPPEVLPTPTWRTLLLDPNHYGATLNLPTGGTRQLIWSYLQTYSRPLDPEEITPYRVEKSRYFRILHPGVELPTAVNFGSCATCHPGASQYNFRTLSPEWQRPT